MLRSARIIVHCKVSPQWYHVMPQRRAITSVEMHGMQKTTSPWEAVLRTLALMVEPHSRPFENSRKIAIPMRGLDEQAYQLRHNVVVAPHPRRNGINVFFIHGSGVDRRDWQPKRHASQLPWGEHRRHT